MGEHKSLLISLAEAKRILNGHDPREYGIAGIGSGRGLSFYVKAIRIKLDELAGLASSGTPASGVNDNDDDEDGFAALDAALGFSRNA